MATTFEELFNKSVLSVVVPHASLGLPRQSDDVEAWSNWFDRLEQDNGDRKMAFFDENLDFLLTLRFPEGDSTADVDPRKPPAALLAFLSHLQVTYDASYIAPIRQPIAPSPAPTPSPALPSVMEVSLDEPLSKPPVPPRTHSMTVGGRLGVGAGGANGSLAGAAQTLSVHSAASSNQSLTPGTARHPSIFPPHTPHPVPAAAESDRAYVQAQGTPLRAGTWGEGPGGAGDAFVLMWDAREREVGDGGAEGGGEEEDEDEGVDVSEDQEGQVQRGKAWVAVFKMTVSVSFLPTKVPDPLLCLTVSATLREKPVAVTPSRQPLVALIEAAEGTDSPADVKPPGSAVGEGMQDDFDMNGMEEVNLFEGLTIGTTFGSSDSDPPLVLPSTRLGSSVRRQAYSLPPLEAGVTSPLPSSTTTPMTSRPTHPTLRKSFRKTMQTVSDFHVRMRTVFVPYFMLPQAGTRKNKNKRHTMTIGSRKPSPERTEDDLEAELMYERELRETGNEEHTVILCVELENKGDVAVGFAVESVKVVVGGEGASTRLIGWGDSAREEAETVFPLLIGPQEQYNLLYAVSFMRAPDSDEFSLARGRGLPGAPTVPQLQRAVAIAIHGRPYELPPVQDEDATTTKRKSKWSQLSYPTQTFPSRWNCVLDLAAQAPGGIGGLDSGGPLGPNDAHPTPASPFPTGTRANFSRPASALITASIRPSTPGSGTATPVSAVAGSKRFTLGMLDVNVQSPGESPRLKPPPSPMNYRSDTSMLNPANQRERDALTPVGVQSPILTSPIGGLSPNPNLNPIGLGQRSPYAAIPPSLAMSAYNRSPATTYAPPPPSAVPRPGSYGYMPEDAIASPVSYDGTGAGAGMPPTTPAYPAFPTSPAPPASPLWQNPVAGTGMQSGEVGPTVEIPREKRASAAGVPPTPGPRVGTGGGFAQMQMQMKGEAAVRGVGAGDGPREPIVVSVGLLRKEEAGRDDGRIYPLDKFTLDIFVFNRSSWTRRFEVSCPDRRRQRKEREMLGSLGRGADDPPGVMPLENRVRVGPLLPSTCQSVRMDFIALKPGVHSIEALTLTDIQSGFTMNLRSVMDVVVHEHERTELALT